jgi:hypothetical protein
MKAPVLAVCLAGLLALPAALAEDFAVEPMSFSKMNATPFSGRANSGSSAFAHLVGLKIGGISFAADTDAVHPVNDKRSSIVGAMTAFQWSGRSTDPMDLTVVLSEANLKRLETYLKQPAPPPEIEFNFQIYLVDATTKETFIRLKSFHYPFRGLLNKVGSEMLSQKSESLPLRGVLSKINGRLALDVDSGSRSARIQALPSGPAPQNLILGNGPDQSRKIHWGR